MNPKAVIFDLGGVVLGSPLHAIAAYERELGIPANFVNRVVAETAPTGAWSRLERGELAMEAFYPAFEADCRAAGHEISASTMMERMSEALLPRPAMLCAIAAIRGAGLRVGALTNNWSTAAEHESPSDGTHALRKHFDVFVESSVEGLRKPDPRIYRLACARLEVEPTEAVFLDDIGSNLKSARKLGMTTIKVVEPEAALVELEAVLGLSLNPG
ncbi:MAG: HAD family phosphatase [Deltaproteobacteria bacterium]|nr:HAD family phosphatase [Deltaproteobacteria bacterium]